jgi:hypothetical protein
VIRDKDSRAPAFALSFREIDLHGIYRVCLTFLRLCGNIGKGSLQLGPMG